MLVGAKGMYYTTDEGKKVLDGCAGMWCVNAGHGREQITEAIRFQAGQMDYATAFQMSHPLAFELSSSIVQRRGDDSSEKRLRSPSVPPGNELLRLFVRAHDQH